MLEEWDSDASDLSATDLHVIFKELTDFYTDQAFSLGDQQPAEISLIKVKTVKQVYDRLAQIDGEMGSAFERRSDWDTATVRDISNLLEKLEMYYSGVSNGALEQGLGIDEESILADIFRLMSQYYLNDSSSNDIPLNTKFNVIFIYERLEDIYMDLLMNSKVDKTAEKADKKIEKAWSEFEKYKEEGEQRLEDKFAKIQDEIGGLTDMVEGGLLPQEVEEMSFSSEES